MRTESLNHKFVYGSPITIGRLVSDVADSTFKFPCNGYNKKHVYEGVDGDDSHYVLLHVLVALQRNKSALSRTFVARTVWVSLSLVLT